MQKEYREICGFQYLPASWRTRAATYPRGAGGRIPLGLSPFKSFDKFLYLFTACWCTAQPSEWKSVYLPFGKPNRGKVS